MRLVSESAMEAASLSETTPLRASGRVGTMTLSDMIRVFMLGLIMIICSAALTNYNKYLMSGPFPFAAHLVLCQMGAGTVFCVILLYPVPSLFPTLADQDKMININRRLMARRVLPIAVCFTFSMVLGNAAYLHASVAFLQMMKGSIVVIVYVLSLFAGLEVLEVRSSCVLFFICWCTLMTIKGEMNFSAKAVVIQGACQFFDGLKLVLQALSLSGELELDAMTYSICVMPLCFMLLLPLTAVDSVSEKLFGTPPQWTDISNNWSVLLPNVVLAFVLNVVSALFVKYSSALSTIMAHLLKNIAIVMTSVLLMHEHISNQQISFFALQLVGIFTWSWMKIATPKFEDSTFKRLVSE